MIIDGDERPDVIENCQNFLILIKKLKLYLIKFNKTDQIIPKIYSLDCEVGGNK